MKLWQKDKTSLKEVERFTIGKDQEMDRYMARFDVLGSLAHIRMLESIGLLTTNERAVLSTELKHIYDKIIAGEFVLEEGVEDIHSQVELELTKKRGEVGKKIHSGRSRNDQVLLDVKLYLRHEI
ncbi:MAG TPA: lyase family protein, partial [Chryseolinea sp.]